MTGKDMGGILNPTKQNKENHESQQLGNEAAIIFTIILIQVTKMLILAFC